MVLRLLDPAFAENQLGSDSQGLEQALDRARVQDQRKIPGRGPEPSLAPVDRGLRALDPFAVELLDGVGGAGDERLGGVVRLEVREDVVGERARVAAVRPADTDAKPEEVLCAELL